MRRVLTAALVSLTLAACNANIALADDKVTDSNAAQQNSDANAAADKPATAASDNKSTTSTPKRGGFHMPVLKKPTAPAANPAVPAPSSGGGAPAAKPAASGPRASLGSRVASTVVGTVVGVPILFVRRAKPEVVTATKELVDNSTNWWYLAPATVLGMPGGLISAAFQGVMVSPYHAWHYSNEPFSPETFSLGDAK